jgi:eukaryotic-like serine/threonine-protein kinase
MYPAGLTMIGAAVGNYVIVSKIGEGGMGAVYVAEHSRLGRKVAVKVLLPHLGRDPQVVARFFNEAKAATEIKNEHIIDVLDFGELPDGSSYIVMEWLEGRSLSALIAQDHRISIERTAHIARGISKALAAAHAHGIVHRDLKPDNIFLVARDGDPDFVKVLDFGIAKLAIADAGDVRTQAGAIMGTPYYMSPEQCNGVEVDQRTDVYALGVILYQMLTGILPFTSPRLAELLVAQATQKPAPLRSHDPSIPPSIESAVLQALEKDPDRRFNSVEALARAFADQAITARGPVVPAVALGASATAPPAPAQTAAELFVRVGVRGKRPLLLVGAATAGVVALVLGLVVLLRSGPSPTPNAASTATAPGATSTAEPSTPVVIKTKGRWKLGKTDCPLQFMPKIVETTQKGASFVSRATGFPDTSGTVEASGHFRARNAGGTCSGTISNSTVTETCTNLFKMSCHAIYERDD